MDEDERPDLRVLLYSPLSGVDPPSGDVTYTEVLLANPPPGVRYTPYADALREGSIRRRGTRSGTPKSPTDFVIGMTRAPERVLRRRVMFREPHWYLSVEPDAFDLVHSHLFALRQVGQRVPMVSSAGFPLSVLYESREGWDRRRARRADRLERALGRALGVHVPGYFAPNSELLTVYTKHYREWLVARGTSANQVLQIAQGLPDRPLVKRLGPVQTFGFIGRDFHRKGGDIAVGAFQLVAARYPDTQLLILTRNQSALEGYLRHPQVKVVTNATRADVLDRYLPMIDVLIAPTRADCGAPYAVIEALRGGIPIVIGNSPWLDDRLDGPAVMRVPLTAEEVADALQRFMSPTAFATAQRAARDLWKTEFNLDQTRSDLRAAYDLAVASAKR